MKTKQIIIISILFTLSICTFSQSVWTGGTNLLYSNPVPSTYVGIGLNNPSRQLHVQTSQTNGGLRVTQTTTGFSALELFNSSSASAHNYALVSTGAGNGEGAGHFGIYDYNSYAYRLFINSTGNIGIGTLTIGSKFQVNGNVAIGYSSSTAAPTNGLCVSDNVGIGTTSPSQKLDVNGNIALTGGGTTGVASINGVKNQGYILINANTYTNNGASLVLYGNSNTDYPGSVRLMSYLTNGKIVFSNYNGSTWPDQMTVLANGNVGIGTGTPTKNLEIAHSNNQGGIVLNSLYANSKSEIRFNKSGAQLWAIGNDFDENNKQTFFIWDHVANSARLIINEYGQVGIGGVIPPAVDLSYKLFVNGGIAARDVKVTAGTFPDYVFGDNYKLKSIYELDNYIKLNNHLPHLPCADDVVKNHGYELGDMQLKLIRTVEEQTLYIISLQKQIDELKEQINAPLNK